MKKFILDIGDKLIDIFAGLWVAIVVILGICSLFSEAGIAGFLGITIIGLLVTVISFYFIYCVIDIKNSLKEIAANTKKD